jgi:hypothetical protein
LREPYLRELRFMGSSVFHGANGKLEALADRKLEVWKL